MDSIGADVNQVMNQLYLIILAIAGAYAVLRVAYSGLMHMGGNEELSENLRRIGVGLFVILTARSIVWLVTTFSKAVDVAGKW